MQKADALFQSGLAAHRRGDTAAGAELVRQAIAIAPRVSTYHGTLGMMLLDLKLAQEAAAAFRTSIRLKPDDAGIHAYLGAALAAAGDFDGAVKAAGATLRLCPGDPAALHMRGVALEKSGQYSQALIDLDAAILADPASYTAHLSRGALLLSMGQIPEALSAFKTAIPLVPDDFRARQCLILAMNYQPGATMRDIGDTARAMAPRVVHAEHSAFECDRSPHRRLRIGYVSGDFRNHPVGYFLHGVLAARDRAEAEITCYSNTPVEDSMTGRLRASVDRWRPIFDLSDDQAASVIQADGIDILIDLAGHTNSNRLSLFARRIAPVQAAWLGYFGTTGLPTIDVVIADRHVVPPGDEAAFGERIVYLPDSYLCFSPPTEAGPVAPLPAGLTGPITFGCFNNRAKLNPEVFAVWARVLAAVPNSRLLLKSAHYGDRAIRRDITQCFAASGIPSDRVLFEPASPITAMFDAYGRVDIALDPFPFAGGVTTAQALWMGVPVISLIGDTWPGRQGASLLGAAGFPEWAVGNTDDYVALAQRLAADRRSLMLCRQGLREAISASPLCDADRFARNLANAYRGMWITFLNV